MFLEPKSINGFLAIIDNGNFEKAAKKLNITTSALSIRMSSLEKTMGEKLLVRTRPFSLTQAGEIFYEYALEYKKMESSLKAKLTGMTE
ncbi:LysR family transcriptional regulator [Rahnella sp. SAP-1]|jgi:LysR family transcriptional regulator (chromosome initiation inhibitor)|uniref:LysR family transcriptional regulator n=1 Tax=Rouxiella aceris TaxID=2703884 RepID=A0A848MKY5_9GAMM|nr:LysR family transcriptional regulator [Rouxiella aceris]NMP28395.1 LysR family transcriptional regulator [Rouxiella aceris]